MAETTLTPEKLYDIEEAFFDAYTSPVICEMVQMIRRVQELRNEWAEVGRHDKAAKRAHDKLDAAINGRKT